MIKIKSLETLLLKLHEVIPCTMETLKVEAISEFKSVKGDMYFKDIYGIFYVKIIETLYKRADCLHTFIISAVNKEQYIENYIKSKNLYIKDKYFKILKYEDRRSIYFNSKYGLCKAGLVSLLEYTEPSIVFAENKTNFFINQSKDLFPNMFSYNNTIFKTTLNTISIFCIHHGGFIEVFYNNHIKGGGCGTCNKRGVYCKTISNRNENLWKGLKIKLYFCKLYSEEEEFYKIGLTSVSIKRRMSKIKDLYSFEEIYYVEVDKLKAHIYENQIMNILKSNKYKPKNKFSGHTECFKLEEKEIKVVIKEMEKILKNDKNKN